MNWKFSNWEIWLFSYLFYTKVNAFSKQKFVLGANFSCQLILVNENRSFIKSANSFIHSFIHSINRVFIQTMTAHRIENNNFHFFVDNKFLLMNFQKKFEFNTGLQQLKTIMFNMDIVFWNFRKLIFQRYRFSKQIRL